MSFTFDEANFIYPETGSLELPYSVLQLGVEITLKHAAETLFSGENYLSGALNDDLKVILSVSLKEKILSIFKVFLKKERMDKYIPFL